MLLGFKKILELDWNWADMYALEFQTEILELDSYWIYLLPGF